MNGFDIVKILVKGTVFNEPRIILNICEALEIFFAFDMKELKDNPQFEIRKRFDKEGGVEKLYEL